MRKQQSQKMVISWRSNWATGSKKNRGDRHNEAEMRMRYRGTNFARVKRPTKKRFKLTIKSARQSPVFPHYVFPDSTRNPGPSIAEQQPALEDSATNEVPYEGIWNKQKNPWGRGLCIRGVFQ